METLTNYVSIVCAHMEYATLLWDPHT